MPLKRVQTIGDAKSANMLIHGDNLPVLQHFVQRMAGAVKCVFIDPPYNTGSRFSHYNDRMDHDAWLEFMRVRIELLWQLLSPEGSLWIAIDDAHRDYLKVACDSIIGRDKYVSSIAWEKRKGCTSDTAISVSHDHLLLYVNNRTTWRSVRNLVTRSAVSRAEYVNRDGDVRGPWRSSPCTAKSGRESMRYEVELPSGRRVTPPAGTFWRYTAETFSELRRDNRLYFGKRGDSMPRVKTFLSEVADGAVPNTWWTARDVDSNESVKPQLRRLLPDLEPFSTPKPEQLLQRILHIATNPGDYVIDAFAGSGTTGAVAHKMGRHWMMIEQGEHARTYIVPRLQKVIDGQDLYGVTEMTGWQGGGGFHVLEWQEGASK